MTTKPGLMKKPGMAYASNMHLPSQPEGAKYPGNILAELNMIGADAGDVKAESAATK